MSKLAHYKDLSPRALKEVANWSTRRWGMATVDQRSTPDFLVIGTKRGGTTSLFNYMLMHPGILGLYPQVRGRKSTDYFFRHFDRGEQWYRSHFHTARFRGRVGDRLGYAPLGGEASPFYMWDPRVAQRAFDLSGRLKAIVLLRDPVERAWSHYQERVQNGVEPLSFVDALAAEESRIAGERERLLNDPGYHSDAYDWYPYRARGVYLPQLENWTSVFPSEQLLVLRSEDMYADVQGVFDAVCQFLGLPDFPLPIRKTFNASARATMPEQAGAELRAYFAGHNARLSEYLGRELAWP